MKYALRRQEIAMCSPEYVTEHILKSRPDIRIIAMSGLGAASPDWAHLRRRVFAMIEKPFDVAHLLRLIRQALDEIPARPPTPPTDSKPRSPA